MEQTTQNVFTYCYWDADNVSIDYIPKVREFFAARNLTPKVCRAFGCCLSKKQVAYLADSGFEPISIKPGANATDFRLTISAVADRHPERRDIVTLVSNDHDFIALLSHLQEQGHQTILFGEKSASEPLRKAANEFALLEKNAAMATTPHQPSVSIGIKDAIADILATHQHTTPPTVGEVGNLLAQRFPTLQRSYTGRLSRRLREIGFVLTKFCRHGVVSDYFVSLP